MEEAADSTIPRVGGGGPEESYSYTYRGPYPLTMEQPGVAITEDLPGGPVTHTWLGVRQLREIAGSVRIALASRPTPPGASGAPP